jgi:hypothetical protein
MLLCKDCHTRIDINQEFFTREKLLKMKKQHEERIERITGIAENNRTTLIIYSANISTQSNPIDINKAELAVITNNMYPAEPLIDLSLYGHASTDNEDSFWQTENANLEKRFAEKLKD